MANRERRAKVAIKRLADLDVRSADSVIPEYQRSKFGHGWDDVDSDGQNERAEVLIAFHRSGNSKIAVEFATDNRKRVVSGRWRCRFSGEWILDASALDIDHLVPLMEAWSSGANEWSQEKRIRYANGVGVRTLRRSWLLPVLSRLNRSKGAKRPDEWLPPNEHYLLNYAADWIGTKKYWGLSVVEPEKAALLQILDSTWSGTG